MTGGIRILEMIRWGVAKKRLGTTALAEISSLRRRNICWLCPFPERMFWKKSEETFKALSVRLPYLLFCIQTRKKEPM